MMFSFHSFHFNQLLILSTTFYFITEKVKSGATTPDVDAIFAKIATMMQATTKPTTTQTTAKSNETVFYTPKLPPAPSIASTKGQSKAAGQSPSTQSAITRPGTGNANTLKPGTNPATESVKTMYPEAESNKTTTAGNVAQQEATTTATTTTTSETTTATAAVQTTRRPAITKPTEYEIVPPVNIFTTVFAGTVILYCFPA